MKRHTRKQTVIMGVLAIGLVALGLIGVGKVSAAKTEKSDVDLKFTVNSTLNLTVDKETITVSDLTPGTTKDSDVATLTVTSTSAGGYYLRATAGTSTTNTSLNQEGGSGKINSIATDANLESMASAANDTWGFKFATGDAFGNYNGLLQDKADNGATGTLIENASAPAQNKKVKCQIGVKAGATLPAGTYKNEIHFYLTAK